MVVGAFGPWWTLLGINSSGTSESGDGWSVIVAAAVAAIALVAYRRTPGRGKVLWCLVAGFVGAVITVHDRNKLSSAGAVHRQLFPAPHVGWGLNLAMVASISLVIAALLLIRVTAPKRAGALAEEPPASSG